MARIHTSQLPEFVAALREVGENFENPKIIERYLPLKLDFDTNVDIKRSATLRALHQSEARRL